MKPITRLPLKSLRVRESGAPFAGVRWAKLPDDHLVKIGEKVRTEVSYNPITDEVVDTIFNSFIEGGFSHQYLRMTNTKFIWETTAQESGYVGQVKVAIMFLFQMFPGINWATCDVYGAEPLVPEWGKWLLIGGGLAVGVVAIGYTLKK